MTAASSPSSSPHVVRGGIAAAVALLCWAGPSIIGKALPLDAISLVFFRGWIGAIWAVGILYLRGSRLTLHVLKTSFWGGVALGCDLIFFFTAIKTTTVANATVISSLQPLPLIFLAPLLFRERLRGLDVSAALVAIGGVALVVFGSSSQTAWNPQGDLWAVLTLFAWTGYLVASKRARQSISSTEFTAGVMVFSTALITPLALIRDSAMDWPLGWQWLGLVAMALLGWCGHLLMNWALAHIPVWLGGTSSLAIPVLASGLAAVFLGERLLPVQLVGMGVVIGSLTVVALRSPRVVAAEPSAS